MHGIDLYAVYRLDRSQPPEALAAQLTTQLNRTDPRDTLTRSRIDTARAILGDPQRRAAYDRQLGDPSAPVTEEVLARIAGRPMPTAPRLSLREQFASTQVKIVGAVTAALAIVLVVAITAVACSGGGDDASTATSGDASTANGGSRSSSASSLPSYCNTANIENSDVEDAKWDDGSPIRSIVLDKAFDLPAEFDGLSTYTDAVAGGGLTQYQDHSIGVRYDTKARGFGYMTPTDSVEYAAVVSPDGRVISVQRKSADDNTPLNLPPKSDLRNDPVYGYFSVAAADGSGITVPAAAAGNKPRMNYVLTALADAYDENAVWVLLRGSPDLYKAHVAITQCLR
ncbi:hypothetical protein [Gordonia sp. 852002-10350_SCH5691597]|uniref:hypothetical protein n=1 Tax=Gordonia sp. 852002-10350_SCH5691597 TaxID=1834085 RepID=UPI0007E9714C|nr:hypothetical protein [Gordonia sp. 852002-10350_SCH5691597]OBA59250.1 hypothetical protein A5777_05275 [Gordonia sp. 852002-10350_SCH5691597]